DKWTVDLGDAVAAYRTDDGSLRLDQRVRAARTNAADWRPLIDDVLGALIAVPVRDGSTAESSTTPLEQCGISDEFVLQVGAMIQPGDAAVLAVVSSVRPDLVVEKLTGYGGKILRASLPTSDPESQQRTIGG